MESKGIQKLRSLIREAIREEYRKLREQTPDKKINISKWCESNGIDIKDLFNSRPMYSKMVEYLSTFSEGDIVSYMNDSKSRRYDRNIIYPSESLIPYPGFLAAALVKSNDAESFSDLYNIYYRRRKVSPAARSIFKKDLFNRGKSAIDPDNLDDLEELPNNDIFGILKIPETRAFIEKFYPQFAG